jgi:hypothetical protein
MHRIEGYSKRYTINWAKKMALTGWIVKLSYCQVDNIWKATADTHD